MTMRLSQLLLWSFFGALLCSLFWLLRDVVIGGIGSSIFLLLQCILVFMTLSFLVRGNRLAWLGTMFFIVLGSLLIYLDVDRISDIETSGLTDFVYRHKLEALGISLPNGSKDIQFVSLGGVFWDGVAVRFELSPSSVNRLRRDGLVLAIDYTNSQSKDLPPLYGCSGGKSWWDLKWDNVATLTSLNNVFGSNAKKNYPAKLAIRLNILPSGDARGYICTASS